MSRVILFTVLGMIVPACGPIDSPPAAVTKAAVDPTFDRLLELVGQRLDLMHEVAHYKWAKKAPIEDPDREAALLRDVAEQGVSLGLDPTTTQAFFRGQIEAAKIIQRADFARWEADPRGPDGEPPDLAGVLRPRIDGLNQQLLAALAETRSRLNDRDSGDQLRARAEQLLVAEGIDPTARATAIAPLLKAARGGDEGPETSTRK